MSEWINPFAGAWHYRSFRNKPEAIQKLEDILFWDAELLIDDSPPGLLVGEIGDGSDVLAVRGNCGYGSPFEVRFQATGLQGTGTDGWVYDYHGYLVATWPHGIAQRAAIVGSVIRSVAHSDGKAKAGAVASFIAVKRD